MQEMRAMSLEDFEADRLSRGGEMEPEPWQDLRRSMLRVARAALDVEGECPPGVAAAYLHWLAYAAILLLEGESVRGP